MKIASFNNIVCSILLSSASYRTMCKDIIVYIPYMNVCIVHVRIVKIKIK